MFRIKNFCLSFACFAFIVSGAFSLANAEKNKIAVNASLSQVEAALAAGDEDLAASIIIAAINENPDIAEELVVAFLAANPEGRSVINKVSENFSANGNEAVTASIFSAIATAAGSNEGAFAPVTAPQQNITNNIPVENPNQISAN